MDENQEENVDSPAEPKAQLKVIAKVPGTENELADDPDEEIIEAEDSAKPAAGNQLKVIAQVPEFENQSDGAEAVKEQPTLKKLGAVTPLSPSGPESTDSSAESNESKEKKEPSNLSSGKSRKAALEAMGVKFRKKGDVEKPSQASGEEKSEAETTPAPPQPQKPLASPEPDFSKVEKPQKSGSQDELKSSATFDKSPSQVITLRDESVPIYFNEPPSKLTHAAFGLWCIALVAVVVLFAIELITL